MEIPEKMTTQGMNQLKTNRLTTRDEPIENQPFNYKG
jgi:hypothetical protein